MRIRGEMTFEPIFITTLFGAHLTVKLEFLKAFGLHAVRYVFGAALFGFWHDGGGGDNYNIMQAVDIAR